jgi:hypothetical protein
MHTRARTLAASSRLSSQSTPFVSPLQLLMLAAIYPNPA